MDYKELIAKIRMVEAILIEDDAPKCANVCNNAATAIETLLEERDEAVEDLHGVCRACVNAEQFEGEKPCCDCTYGTGIMWDADNWEWRGPQKGCD